jgi:hypothetical protein
MQPGQDLPNFVTSQYDRYMNRLAGALNAVNTWQIDVQNIAVRCVHSVLYQKDEQWYTSRNAEHFCIG